MVETVSVRVVLLVAAALACGAGVTAALGAWRRRRVAEGLDRRLGEMEVRLRGDGERLRDVFEQALRDNIQAAGRAQGELGLQVTARLEEVRAAVLETLGNRFQQIQQAQGEALAAARREQGESLQRLEQRVAADLAQLRQDNEVRLERIRATVDEKLHATLETRLGQSFRLVSERLEQVHKGLGEMQALASGVGDLKRVLTNVRARGTFGEVQLAGLLEQVFTPSQYDTNVATVPNSRERVEFALRLPGRDGDGSVVHLPIDAKFPQEDYLRLQDAYEAGDAAGVATAQSALRNRFLAEASSVREKYLAPPHTTDFALLFVPTEGLYAEALRIPGLVESLQRSHHVVLVGPTTLYAVLNSLQVGFRTLAIEQRSSEVWKLLAAVKTEFQQFGRSLGEVKKKLQEASNKIEQSERRSRVMQRHLKDVEALPGSATSLPPPADPDDGA